MRMTRCDRCGAIVEEGEADKYLLYKNSTSHSDKEIEMDLCRECEKQLLSIFTPQPQIYNP